MRAASIGRSLRSAERRLLIVGQWQNVIGRNAETAFRFARRAGTDSTTGLVGVSPLHTIAIDCDRQDSSQYAQNTPRIPVAANCSILLARCICNLRRQ